MTFTALSPLYSSDVPIIDIRKLNFSIIFFGKVKHYIPEFLRKNAITMGEFSATSKANAKNKVVINPNPDLIGFIILSFMLNRFFLKMKKGSSSPSKK